MLCTLKLVHLENYTTRFQHQKGIRATSGLRSWTREADLYTSSYQCTATIRVE